jgi:hypothetical protein
MPGRGIEDVHVDFPRPRRQELLLAPEFHEMADRLTRSLLPEGDDERVA